jgi:NADPH:quinone reductase-like Zn-dependent oxidoreductase
MRAAAIKDRFGLSEVQILEMPEPTPGPDHALIKVRAASVNYRDVMVADGRYNPRYALPLILGSDAVGEIVELGPSSGESSLRAGDRVCPLVVQGWRAGSPLRNATRNCLGGPLPGVFAEYVVARTDSLFVPPAYLSDVEAATLPCAALTAWSALKTLASTGANDVVLTLGSGGVSLFALQVARASGARVVATSRDESKRARLLELGAERVLSANDDDWGQSARAFAGGEGVDHVIEVGGAATLAQSLNAVRPGGVISLIGVLGGKESSLNLLPIVMRNVRVQGVFVGHASGFTALLDFFAEHRIKPVIDSVYPLDAAAAALRHLESGRHFGKVCLSI